MRGPKPIPAPAPGAGPAEGPPPAAPDRNPGMALDLEWIEHVRVDAGAMERRAGELAPRPGAAPGETREGGQREEEVARLLQAVRLLDLTSLTGDETPARIRRLCARALEPVRREVASALGIDASRLSVAAVCLYHRHIPTAVEALAESEVPVAAVAGGFPHGAVPTADKVREIRASVAAGAREIDAVITRGHVLAGRWRDLHDEVRELREACGDALLKTILATGELGSLRNVARASLVCMMGGADFVKTSTGKERVNATLPVGVVMARAIRSYARRTGHGVGLKPAGGIRTTEQASSWLALVAEELGPGWVRPGRLRLGASALLADLERRLVLHAGWSESLHDEP